MKYVILRCEDLTRTAGTVVSLLEGAKTVHLQHLAQAGTGGVLHRRSDEPSIDRFQFHRGLFGLSATDLEAAAGRCYAAGARVELTPEETAWCCELITHQDGTIIDPLAGNIPTKESEVLIRALNGELGADTRRWEAGQGSHHLLVVRDPSLAASRDALVKSPELLVGRPWTHCLPRGAIREPLRVLIEQASKLLETQSINRVRVDLGENPANLVWLWGAADGQPHQTFRERTGLSGAMISSAFPMRGFASCLGLDWKSGPTSFDEKTIQQLMKGVAALIERRDVVYVHLWVDSADPVERLCAMERIDQLLLKPLTDMLPRYESWRLLDAIDDRSSGSVLFAGIGSELPSHPVAHLDGERVAATGLSVEDVGALYAWFTRAA